MGADLSALTGLNLTFAEEMYRRFIENPESVSPDWRACFEALRDEESRGATPRGNGAPTPPAAKTRAAPMASQAGGGDIDERLPFLLGLQLFRDVPQEEVSRVARVAEEIRHRDKEVLFREGEAGNDLFIVMEGSILVRRAGRLVAALGRGEVVGEMAVLDGEPRSADAVAHGPVRLLCLRGRDLVELIEARPQLARGVIRVLTERLRETGARQERVDQLIRAYRVRGHLHAAVNPLEPPSYVHPELDPAHYGFTPQDLDVLFSSASIPGAHALTLREILALLRNTYCRSIGVQFMHIDDLRIRDWLQERMEKSQNRRTLSRDEQIRILTKLTDAEIFEQFIHAKFAGAKRFSLEGAESLIPLLDMAIEEAARKGVTEIVLGMAHRGRLNVLANIMDKKPHQIFREFEEADASSLRGKGDVKYHLGHSTDRTTTSGDRIHLSLCFNPSHLEFVGPVVMGRVRAKQERFEDLDHARGIGIIIHGDAAFAGQGVIQELFNMSELDGYSTGGTVHIIVNNQLGFTTLPKEGRSTQYATDVARMLQIPIFHVNGEHPEPVAQVIKLAMDFREAFKKDVVIDMYCYRRHGHNEGDEPAFTQPLLYEKIRQRESVRDAYLDSLLTLGGITREDADRIELARKEALERDLAKARSPEYVSPGPSSGLGVWRPYRGGQDAEVPEADTRVPREHLSALLLAQTRLPETFHPHPKIERLLEARRAMASGDRSLDWAAGEALAFATLLREGTRVRLTGQDSARGTFSQRHAVLHDVRTGETHVPLEHLSPDQGRFHVINSPLNEIGSLGFEYGFSLDSPDVLTLWEAQFGDFANVAQVIFDQFITSGEQKWSRLSGLVVLLPHGFEGQGPEHSSARLERFLSLAAEDNIQVVNLTTPAQIFHCLRRQVLRPIRKPLVVMSPKSLLRHPRATSTLDDLAGGRFHRVIPDGTIDPRRTRRVLLTSGKIYHELAAAREDRKIEDVAIVRLEQFYPFDPRLLEDALSAYPDNTELTWVQEEPSNMGAWPFLQRTWNASLSKRFRLSLVSRPDSASPATGSAASHRSEQSSILEAALG